MADRKSSDEADQAYSRRLAGLVVDALVDANIVAKSDFDRAVEIAAGEIYVRRAMGDR
jgi:hypothetical protein